VPIFLKSGSLKVMEPSGPLQAGNGIALPLPLLIYLLTPYSKVLLEKLTGSQVVLKFPAFYVTRRIITIFTNARYLSLTWATSIQSVPPHRTCPFSVAQVLPQYKSMSEAVSYRVGFWGLNPSPRNSEVLTKLSRIPSSVENISVTT
jgi:hypothetical protein